MAPKNAQHRTAEKALPLYLSMAMGNYLSSLMGGMMQREEFAGEHLANPPTYPISGFAQHEANAQLKRFMAGVMRYLHAPRNMLALEEKPASWARSSSILRDYGAGDSRGEILLCIPSLINRSYILDLDKERSLLRFLAEKHHPYLLEWGEPGLEENAFTLEEYILKRLQPALDFLYELHKKPIVLAGYCMGGLMAMALTQLNPEKVKAIALFATPWDFHAERLKKGSPTPPLDPELVERYATLLDIPESYPKEWVQAWFYWLNPLAVQRKFERFSEMQEECPEWDDFIAIEDWLNDGVSLSKPVVKECLVHWGVENAPSRKNWRIGGEIIAPEQLVCPSFMAVPEHDVVVTPASALPLAELLPNNTVLRIPAGHVSMVVGRRARELLWTPLEHWLSGLA